MSATPTAGSAGDVGDQPTASSTSSGPAAYRGVAPFVIRSKLTGSVSYGNPWPTWTGIWTMEKMFNFFTRKCPPPPTLEQLNASIPVCAVTESQLASSQNLCCWMGHSTEFLRLNGVNILTDPIWGPIIGLDLGFTYIGRERLRPPPIDLAHLPSIDFVIISHNHVDHLDFTTICALKNLFDPMFLVPIGAKSWFLQCGFTRVEELTWWDSYTSPAHSNVTFTFVPAQHWSGRSTVLDANASLWGGWVLTTNENFKVYFAGDTGYCSVFPQIANLGPFDLSFIPIAPENPRHVMKAQHVGFEEAVKIHQEVNSKCSYAIHWGTFPMGADEPTSAPSQLQQVCHDHGVTSPFTTPSIGQVINLTPVIPSPVLSTPTATTTTTSTTTTTTNPAITENT
ncbi:N-acyl-phosphatidylethanolamine-hydrolyzing phospholipase D [Pelomyxa schiedti]|nr:N-acyl-phosphatidylethanolamine-hydrolyzing phospholipase D [Pelomyxa schiedti]